MKKLYILLFVSLIANIHTIAQNNYSIELNKKSFDELFNKYDTTKKNFNLPKAEQPVIGNNQQDLNKQALEQFKNINTKEKNLTKPDTLKKTETVPYEIIKKRADSLLQIIQKNKLDSLNKIKKDSIDKAKIFQQNKAKQDSINKAKQLQIQQNQAKQDSINKAKILENKQKTQTDFSTQPIIKSENKTEPKPTLTVKPKINYDTLKNKPIKDFYIETQPIVNQNGKTVEVEKPKEAIVKKPSETEYKYSEKEILEKKKKESYNIYQREADSIRNKNKLMLDSLLATLNVDVPIQVGINDYIEIFLSGGGLYGGVNPKEYDRIMIYNNGLIQREYKSKIGGVEKYEKKVTRDDLLKLAQFITDLGYFKYNEAYECDDNDVACKQRMKQNPTPVPLNISIAIGIRRHKIDIDLYAPMIEKNWVKYPENLIKILNAIYALSEK